MRSYFIISSLLLLAGLTGLAGLAGLTGCTSPSGVWFDASYTDNTPSYDTNPPQSDVTGFDLSTYDRSTGEKLLQIGRLSVNSEMPQFFAAEEGSYWLSCNVSREGEADSVFAGATMTNPVTLGEGLDVYCHCDLDVVGAARGLYCDRGESSETGAEEG